MHLLLKLRGRERALKTRLTLRAPKNFAVRLAEFHVPLRSARQRGATLPFPGIRFQARTVPMLHLDHDRASRRDHDHIDFVRLAASSDPMRKIGQYKSSAVDWLRP
jgi:hypothetical protein